MKKSLILAALLAFATPVFANQCPTLLNKIDEAMKSAQLDDAKKQQVMDLYNKGKASHEAGDHAASEAGLSEPSDSVLWLGAARPATRVPVLDIFDRKFDTELALSSATNAQTN